MLADLRYLLALVLIASASCLAVPARAAAGWMGFRNDTAGTLVIQETVTVGSVAKPVKPQKIFVNETIRDTAPTEGRARTFTIYDPASPDRPLFTGPFPGPGADENVLFVLKADGKGGLIIEAVRHAIGTVRNMTPKR